MVVLVFLQDGEDASGVSCPGLPVLTVVYPISTPLRYT